MNCPKCDKVISGYPALSRKDNDTYICSACGTKEALEEYFRFVNTNKENK